MAFIRKRKQGNNVYAHEVTSYRDPLTKKVKQKTRYLGAIDPATGNIIPANSRSKKNKIFLDFGNSFIIKEFLHKKGLYTIINNVFKEITPSISALICYQIIEGAAMKSAIHWIEDNAVIKFFKNANLSSQNISKILKILGDQDLQSKFFSGYTKTFFAKNNTVLIDFTALINSIKAAFNSWGMTDSGVNKNISCLMLVEKTSKLPIYFRCLPGSIPDVSLLKNTLKDLSNLRLEPDNVIFDAGFFSSENIKLLNDSKINFVSRMPKNRITFNELLKKHKTDIENSKNTVIYNKRALFIIEDKINIEGIELFAYLILDPEKRGRDIKNYALKCSKDKTIFDNTSIQNKGFFVLISSNSIGIDEIIPTYYRRQGIEEVFGICKSMNNTIPLRRHNDTTVRGFLMLSFLTLIIYIQIRKDLNGLYTVNDCLLILRALKCQIDLDNDEIIIAERTKKQSDILKQLDLEI